MNFLRFVVITIALAIASVLLIFTAPEVYKEVKGPGRIRK